MMNRCVFSPACSLLHCLAGVVLTLLFSVTHAADNRYITDLQASAKTQHLWLENEWLNLLHYSGEGKTPENYQSEVNDERFFIADNGDANPEAELLATLAALYRTDIAGDEHAQCKFVARLNWLKQKLPIDVSTLPAVQCDSYTEWRKHVNSDLVTLVFCRR
jgi:hypothetical protein